MKKFLFYIFACIALYSWRFIHGKIVPRLHRHDADYGMKSSLYNYSVLTF